MTLEEGTMQNSDHNDHHSDGSSSDFFSPNSAPFFSNSHKTRPSDPAKLPPLHDSSWIGARMSPIHSFDKEAGDEDDYDEEDDEDERFTSIYRRALHDSIEASIVTEKSSLLGKDRDDPRSRIHPLWDPPPDDRNGGSKKGNFGENGWRAAMSACVTNTFFSWGTFVCVISGVFLAAMASHDVYLLYLSIRWGNFEEERHRLWQIPWLMPSGSTLLRFGGFSPKDVLQRNQYWRLLTSLFMSASVVEWILMVASWRLVLTRIRAPPWHRWTGSYLASAVTGQLWMMAWDSTDGAVAGCASWGTCGVLCAAGMLRPARRFLMFLMAIALVVLALLQRPYNSVLGALGSSFFGWSFATAWMMPRIIPTTATTTANLTIKARGGREADAALFSWFSGVATLSMWVLPGLWIAFGNY